MKSSLTIIFLFITGAVIGQDQQTDRELIDQLVANLYESISFTDGNLDDYGNIPNIYHPDAEIGAVDSSRVRMFKVADFQERNREMFEKNSILSFVEQELKGITEVYGGVATRFSSYEFTLKSKDREMKVRGVNAMQLIKVPEAGWQVYSLIFSDEGHYPELPGRYTGGR